MSPSNLTLISLTLYGRYDTDSPTYVTTRVSPTVVSLTLTMSHKDWETWDTPSFLQPPILHIPHIRCWLPPQSPLVSPCPRSLYLPLSSWNGPPPTLPTLAAPSLSLRDLIRVSYQLTEIQISHESSQKSRLIIEPNPLNDMKSRPILIVPYWKENLRVLIIRFYPLLLQV